MFPLNPKELNKVIGHTMNAYQRMTKTDSARAISLRKAICLLNTARRQVNAAQHHHARVSVACAVIYVRAARRAA